MPGCGSGAVVCSCSLLFGCHLGRRQAETPITPLSKFSRPALNPHLTWWAFVVAGCTLPVLSALAHISQHRQASRERAQSQDFLVEQLKSQRELIVGEVKTILAKPESPEKKLQEFEQFTSTFPSVQALAYAQQ